MTHRSNTSDKEEFLRALRAWDRPEAELKNKILDADVDIDSHLDRLFSMPNAGFLTE